MDHISTTQDIQPSPADLGRHYACIAISRLFPSLGRHAQIGLVGAYLRDDGTIGPARMNEIRAECGRLAQEALDERILISVSL